MKAIPHWQQRQDPRWQKRRLEIMQRDGFKCLACGSTSEELHVHHRWYVSGRVVWEYPDIALVTLCKTCHFSIEPWHEVVRFEENIMILDSISWYGGCTWQEFMDACYDRGCEPQEVLKLFINEYVARVNKLHDEMIEEGIIVKVEPAN